MPEGRRVESNSRESHLSCQHDVKRSLMPEGCMLTNGWWFQQGLQVLTQSYIRLWIFFSQIRPWRSLDFCMRCLQIEHRSSPLAAGPLESLYLPGHTIENTIKKKQRTFTTTLHLQWWLPCLTYIWNLLPQRTKLNSSATRSLFLAV